MRTKQTQKSNKMRAMRITITEDINNGVMVNDLFNSWDKVSTEEQHTAVLEEASNKRFGTYNQFGVIELIDMLGMKESFKSRSFVKELINYQTK
jgi:hypothetical protein